MALPDWRTSGLTKHGKRADTRKRKLAHLACKPSEMRLHQTRAPAAIKAPTTNANTERIAALTRHAATLKKELAASQSAQAQLTAELERTRQALSHTQAKLAETQATLTSAQAERRKAIHRYSRGVTRYYDLCDKYNQLCDMVQASICTPVDQYGTFGEDGLMSAFPGLDLDIREEVKADLATTQARRLSAQLGIEPLSPPPARPVIDID